ncbi:Rho guanine nucleotide exchange factor 7 [Melipona quadrifasciata]|uniref:Rho guanine nucleotide exchange factor 7 n=1 Tax=Melipona quadrifasciata TaxID=166423 RepID=A0A0M9A580_9HYME|nr:Rho guanine nucleotide exchange factor 7 [Melipona quadrifasciata]
MSKSDTPKFVTALFSFKGKNNDELCFKKGDVITITQTDDEGWWEGTLHDKTGWFPANYVKECRITDNSISTMKTSPEKSLQGLINNFLHPLESANILNKEEYKQLLGNIHEVLEVHQRLLSNLEAAITQDRASRVGNLFLTLATKLKSIHITYCGNHPTAVCILDRDELNDFMERSGAISPGILVLTTGLSKPFRRLDKYSAMLQELERYTEKNHPDRGDTQRSIVVYREIADRCASIRKQRELALQILTSGIKGWEGEELSSLGEILYVGSVTLASGTTGLDRRDRYFVLFPTTLLVLSASPRMSSFVYEGKLPLTGITVTQIEDTDEIRNAFEITGPMIERILVLCATKEDQQRWIELLIQEQTSNSLVKSPTTSRVSYNLPPYALAMKCWKTNKFTDDQLATINSVHHPSGPVCNSNIIEHCCQTDTHPQGFGFQTNVISVGSSDSGMAESYRLNSSEINSSCKSCTCVDNNIERPVRLCSDESENDENNFEYQCVCTSPFDSIPRDSAHLSDLSKHIDNTLDPSICETASTIVYNSDHTFTTNKIQKQENELSNVMQRRFTQPIPYTHQTIVRKAGRKAIQPNRPVENDYNETKQIYTSGLYAHWWLKKSIPFSGCSDQGKLPWHGCSFLFTCLICNQQSGKQQQQLQVQQQQQQPQSQHRSITDHCVSLGIKTPWSIASLRPASPFYSFKVFDERQFEEDAIILKVIEAYCLSVNARFTVHSGESTSMLEYDSHKMRDRTSLTHNRGNWDFCSNRTLSETVRTLKNQMTDLQSQMSLLTKQLDEERRSRLSLAATVKRSMGVVDGSVP